MKQSNPGLWLNKDLKMPSLVQDWENTDLPRFSTFPFSPYPFHVVFSGIKAADAKELKQIASTPSLNHVFNVANFDAIVDIQNEIISQVCSGVDEQLGELISGEEGEWTAECSMC